MHSGTGGPNEHEERTVGQPFPIVHPEREGNIPVITTTETEAKTQVKVSAGKVYNKINTVNLTRSKGGSQVCAHCVVNGKTILAIIDTGAEMSLLRKSISDELKLTLKEAKFDLMSLSNMAVETFGVVDTRAQFMDDKEIINAQAHFSVVPDVIFDPAIGALLGMDVLKPLRTIIDAEVDKITIKHKNKTVVKDLIQVRGIRSRDETMAALVSILFREKRGEDVDDMVHRILSRTTTLVEIPILETKLVNVDVKAGVPRFSGCKGVGESGE